MKNSVLELGNLIQGFKLCCQTEGKSLRTIVWYTELLMSFSNYMKEELQCHDLSAFNIDTVRSYIIHLRNKPKFQGHPFTPQQNNFLSPRTIHCAFLRKAS